MKIIHQDLSRFVIKKIIEGRKKMKRIKIMALITCFCMVFAIAACDSISETTAEPTVSETEVYVRSGWNEAALPQFPDAIAAYEESNPGIKINMEYTPAGDDSMAKLRAEFVAGNPPDVVQAWKTDFNEFVEQGLVVNLTDEYEERGWEEGTVLMGGARSWAAPLSEAANPDADVYGVADYLNTSVFFYNKIIFDELNLEEPTDIEELIDVAHALTEAGYRPLIGGGAKDNFTDLIAKIQVQITGLQYLIDLNNGDAKLTDEPMLKTMQIVERLINEGVVDPDVLTWDDHDCVAEMAKGTTGMFMMHTVYDKNLRDAQAESDKLDFAIMKGIKFVDDPVEMTSATYGGVWMVPTFSDVQDEAKDILFYLFGPEVSEKSAETGRITNMIEANHALSSETIKVVVDHQLPNLTNKSFYLIDMVPGAVLTSLLHGMQEMLQGNADAETVVENAQIEMDNVLADKE
jgi:raffinose/stachyose/melibiose transport system substrate-binding protein